jgi:hypothetical protein
MMSRTSDDWLAVTPDGRYDGTPEGVDRLAAFARGTTAWRPSGYAGAQYVRDLLAGLFRR